MIAGLSLLLAAAVTVSSLTVHTQTAAPHCIDLQCPSIALDLGEQQLINDETFSKEQCESCAQCTNHGYSVCMRLSATARTPGARRCACSHSTPANCHNEVMPTAHRPVNITMSLFNVCYLSSIQSPPKPLAIQEKNSIIVTVESFWTEHYWKRLELSNLTLHYEYLAAVPEHCDGHVVTTEPEFGAPVHTCTSQVPIAMSGAGAEGGKKTVDDYEHSEGYDTYDDELPPEVQFDREVFHSAKEVKFFYSVSVRRPRQLTKEHTADPFRDITTEVDSERLHYELRPYKANEKKEDNNEAAHENAGEEEEEEDFPEETDFFAGDKKEDEARKKMRDRAHAAKDRLHVTGSHHDVEEEDERDKNVATSENAEILPTSAEAATVSPTEENEIEAGDKSGEKKEEEEKEEEEGDELDTVRPTSDEMITEDLLEEHSANSTEVLADFTAPTNSTEDADDEEDDVTSTLEPSESAEIEKEIEEERGEDGEKEEGEEGDQDTTTPEDGETSTSDTTVEDDVEKTEESNDDKLSEVKKLLAYFDPNHKSGLAFLVLAITLALSLVLITIACCCKKDGICGKKATKTSGGYTYNAATQQTRPLVVEPSREPLNQ